MKFRRFCFLTPLKFTKKPEIKESLSRPVEGSFKNRSRFRLKCLILCSFLQCFASRNTPAQIYLCIVKFNLKSEVMDYNLTSHFYLKTGKLNSKGQAPVYMRITLNGQRTEISTNQSILSGNWNKHTERAKGNREETRIFNNYLDSLASKVNRHFNDLLNTGSFFYVNDLKNSMNGKGKTNKTLIQVYNENNQLMKQEEGSKYMKNTVERYFISIERLKKFLREEYGIEDIPLERLNYQFVQR